MWSEEIVGRGLSEILSSLNIYHTPWQYQHINELQQQEKTLDLSNKCRKLSAFGKELSTTQACLGTLGRKGVRSDKRFNLKKKDSWYSNKLMSNKRNDKMLLSSRQISTTWSGSCFSKKSFQNLCYITNAHTHTHRVTLSISWPSLPKNTLHKFRNNSGKIMKIFLKLDEYQNSSQVKLTVWIEFEVYT